MTEKGLDLARIRSVLRLHLPEIHRDYGVQSLGLFDSYVRGDQRPGSDRMGRSKTIQAALVVFWIIISFGMSSSPCLAGSPQKKLIAFTRGEGRAQEIVAYDTTTGVTRYFTDNDVWDGLPTLSPSGRWLAFVRAIPDRDVLAKPDFTLHEMDEILVVDPRNGDVICTGKSDHTEPYELGCCAEYWPDIPPLAGVMNLCWTQDETGILFEVPCSVTNDLILRMDVPSGELHMLCLGNDLRPFGQDRFLIWQHEYDKGGGCEHYYTIDSRGNLVSALPCPNRWH